MAGVPSNSRAEAMNTGIRLLTRMAYGFRSPDALIALAMLKHGACALLCPVALIASPWPHDPT